MKVLHLSTSIPWGGGQQQTLLLIEGLFREGVLSHAAVQEGSAIASRLPGTCPVLRLRLRGPGIFVSAFRIARYCNRHDIDLLHAHSGKAHTLALLALFFGARCPLVVHRRISSRPRGRFKFFHPGVKAYIAISEDIVAKLRGIGLPPDKIELIYSSVDPEPFQRAKASGMRGRLSREMGWPGDLPIIGAVARLDPPKGIDVLVRAMKLLGSQGVECGCIVAGEGHDRHRIEALIAQCGLTDRMKLLGERRDIPDVLSAVDVFAMPSLKEGLGSAVIEAFHAGCCVVASRVGGLPELVKHEQTGLLVEPGDPASLAAAIRRLLDDAVLRKKLAGEGSRFGSERFCPGTMIGATIALYRKILETKSGERQAHAQV